MGVVRVVLGVLLMVFLLRVNLLVSTPRLLGSPAGAVVWSAAGLATTTGGQAATEEEDD